MHLIGMLCKCPEDGLLFQMFRQRITISLVCLVLNACSSGCGQDTRTDKNRLWYLVLNKQL